MAGNIQKRPNGKWRARYRDAAHREHARHFTRKLDAERWLEDVTAAVRSGTYVDPSASRVLVRDWCQIWLESQGHLKPSTWDRYAGIVRTHVAPKWGPLPISAVTHAEVQRWCSRLAKEHSPSTAVKAHRVLSLALGLAVRDGRLARNPAAGVRLPRIPEADRRYLSHAQVRRLAIAAGPGQLVIMTLAYTGVRFGELAALRVRRVDLDRRRIEIAESVTSVNGVLAWGPPKGHARRWVAVPRLLIADLARQIDGREPDDLVFTTSHGQVLRAGNFRRDVFTAAAQRAELDGLTPHALRHTAASLAIAAGANVKVVQAMLGHKSATLTLDLYGHLFADQLDDVADAMDAAARLVADSLRTGPVAVPAVEAADEHAGQQM